MSKNRERFKAQFDQRHKDWNSRMASPWTAFSSYQASIENKHERRAAYLAYPFVAVATIFTGLTVGLVKFLDWLSYPFQWLGSEEESNLDLDTAKPDNDGNIQDGDKVEEARDSLSEGKSVDEEKLSSVLEEGVEPAVQDEREEKMESRRNSTSTSTSASFFQPLFLQRSELNNALKDPETAVKLLKQDNSYFGENHDQALFKIYQQHANNEGFVQAVTDQSLPEKNCLSSINLTLGDLNWEQKETLKTSKQLFNIVATQMQNQTADVLGKMHNF